MRLPNYADLSRNFPNLELNAVKRLIGGHVNQPAITNACAIRLSRALNYCGTRYRIPSPRQAGRMNVVSGSDKLWYAYRVSEMADYLSRTYGAPTLQYTSSTHSDYARLFKVRGIIRFVIRGWTDASGHMDLWDGPTGTCGTHCYFAPGSGATLNAVYVWAC